MSKKIEISASHNGQTFTRTTARTYTHVVICKSNRAVDIEQAALGAKLPDESDSRYTQHGQLAWCGSEDLAITQANEARKERFIDVQIIPVNA
jgi:hypothetical protein